MAGYPSRPASCGLDGSTGLGGLEEGPLWNTIKRQLYKPEVTLIKRLVGDKLIQQNRLMWDEIASLRQMLADFQEQNDSFSEGRKQQMGFCDTQHRDLLRRQAQIILDDLRSQAEACGHTLEDMVPELRTDQQINSFLFQDGLVQGDGKAQFQEQQFYPPATPSTRPSTASTRNSCSTPDLIHSLSSMSSLPMGRQLGVDDIDEVAAGIKEALEAEHESLLATIAEEMQQLEAEDERRASMARRAARGEPSTAKLQQFLHKLQDLLVSPGLRTLSLTAPAVAPDPVPVVGGANVRRLQALISLRRQSPSLTSLNAVPEAPADTPSPLGLSARSFLPGQEGSAKGAKPAYDPFFDDPFES
eukprot:gb/GFBE01000855.1/.p1 GENE.gb/GFBE01000855.1/~~gb/GFBE01000855.1/.p1  ORF type:complete len:359 (+),score=69.68 gb/GFBE01000855.1/:1-1077(+)